MLPLLYSAKTNEEKENSSAVNKNFLFIKLWFYNKDSLYSKQLQLPDEKTFLEFYLLHYMKIDFFSFCNIYHFGILMELLILNN